MRPLPCRSSGHQSARRGADRRVGRTRSTGVATFPGLSIDTPGPYTLQGGQPRGGERAPDRRTVRWCPTRSTRAGSQLHLHRDAAAGNSYTTIPKQGTAGGVGNVAQPDQGLKVSCDFAPFNYPDASASRTRSGTSTTTGDSGSVKTNVIFIEKEFVQITSDNGTSKYRVCYSLAGPIQGPHRQLGPEPDPWRRRLRAPTSGRRGSRVCFRTAANKKPVEPCSVGWTGTGGNRIRDVPDAGRRSVLPLTRRGQQALAARHRPGPAGAVSMSAGTGPGARPT